MANQVIGSIPEFTQDSEPVQPQEVNSEVASESDAEPAEETSADKEKETPSQPPQDIKPAAEPEKEPSADTRDLRTELLGEIEGLKQARKELIFELQDLRGQKRELKEEQISQVQEEIDKLEDINSDDVQLIDRILRAKGYVSKESVQKMFLESKRQDEIDKFFKEFPEYSEENDPDRKKFGPLLREVSLYKEPTNPSMWAKLLRKAHQALTGNKASGERGIAITKRRLEVAGVGSGGAQRSSSVKPFSIEKRIMLLNGGWSEEDIQRMEERSSLE